MQPTGPFTVESGKAFSYSPPAQLLNPVAALVLNKSPYDLVLSAPVSKTVPAWTTDLVMGPGALAQTPGAAAISHVAGVASLASGTPTGALASLYIDWLAQGEVPAGGTYPMTLGVPNLDISGGTVDVGTISGDVTLAAGTTVDVGTISGAVDLAAGTTVDVNTVSSITAGSITIDNARVSAGVNLAPRATGFSYVDTTSAVLLGSVSSPAYNVLSVGASNNSGNPSQVTFKDTYTGSLLSFILQNGQTFHVPLDFLMQAGSELQFTATQTTIGWVVYG